MTPSPEALLELAQRLARVVHAGQVRKDGTPMIDHVERVAGRLYGYGPRSKTVAYLHDVVEDTPVSEFGLLSMGFPDGIVRDVMALSRRANEPYTAFTERTCVDGTLDALRVKLADLADNLEHPIQSLDKRYRQAADRISFELQSRVMAGNFYAETG